MEENTKKQKRNWRKSYRMVLTNLETLEAEYRVSFTQFQVLLVGIVVFFVLFLMFYLMVSFTPLKRLLPGFYAQVETTEIVKLRSYIQEMDETIQMQDQYILSLRSLISGKPIDSLQKENLSEVRSIDNPQPTLVGKVKEDEELRENIERSDRLNALRSSLSTEGSTTGSVFDYSTLIPPVVGSISKPYSPSENHYGIDILGSKNTAVKAIASGLVIQSDWSVETGNTIMILHDNGLVSVYKHNSSLLKNNYDKVQAGEAVAIIGNTGTLSTGPHLHFEIWVDGSPKDPTAFINFK